MAKVGTFRKWELSAKGKSAPKWDPDKEPEPRHSALMKAFKRWQDKNAQKRYAAAAPEREKRRRFYEQERSLWADGKK
jgi:hypothetical protein